MDRVNRSGSRSLNQTAYFSVRIRRERIDNFAILRRHSGNVVVLASHQRPPNIRVRRKITDLSQTISSIRRIDAIAQAAILHAFSATVYVHHIPYVRAREFYTIAER